MSCSSTGGVFVVGDVEAFVYHDPSGNTPTEVPAAKSDEKPKEPLRSTQDESARLIAQARAEGIAEGESRARLAMQETLVKERQRIAEVVTNFQKKQAEYYSKVEVELVHFALSIAAKILHREAQVDRMVVAGLVKVMIDKLQQGSRVVVRVRPEQVSGWRHYFRDNTTLQVVEDASLEAGDCTLETELGTTEMGIDAQLKELERGFADLLAQRPEPK